MTDRVVRVTIEPAFRLVITDDDTGKSWAGHTWYGDTALDGLRKLRNTVHLDDKSFENIRVKTDTPQLVAGKSWKEVILE